MKNRAVKSNLARVLSLPTLAISLVACRGTANAQPYAIDWFSGGGVSAGGSYTLAGSMGQADAGTLSGGRYTLEGGFRPGVLVALATGEAPRLLIQITNVDVQISWFPPTPGFTLEQADDLSSLIWEPAPSGNPVTISASKGTRFYRLRKS